MLASRILQRRMACNNVSAEAPDLHFDARANRHGWDTMHPDVHQINHAVRICLKRCVGSGAPLARLAEFCEGLRAIGWREGDIKIVEDSARRMLEAIVLKPDSQSTNLIESMPKAAR
jgi:hypothetical protein